LNYIESLLDCIVSEGVLDKDDHVVGEDLTDLGPLIMGLDLGNNFLDDTETVLIHG
jgi:hypothetical protein